LQLEDDMSDTVRLMAASVMADTVLEGARERLGNADVLANLFGLMPAWTQWRIERTSDRYFVMLHMDSSRIPSAEIPLPPECDGEPLWVGEGPTLADAMADAMRAYHTDEPAPAEQQAEPRAPRGAEGD
jgi:hypothetical protein